MEKMLSTNEAAQLLDVSAIRVRQLIAAGSIQAQKVGRDYIIAATALKGVRTYGKPGRPATVAAKAGTKKPAKKAARKSTKR